MSELTSATVPPIGADDHLRGGDAGAGDSPEAILYVDLGCPHCAATWQAIGGLELRLCLRHFPVASKHRRATALHAAAEAASLQSEPAFWAMVDSIYGDQGRQDDPHLWRRAESLELELERFERDRRSQRVAERVRRDFESGLRAGVAATPAAFVGGRLITNEVVAALRATQRVT